MTQDLALNSELNSAKNLVWWLYLFHGLSLVFSLGLFSFIPLIINYVKRNDAGSTFISSHHSWQIRSFWWYLVWVAIGYLAFITFIFMPIAFIIWAVVWIWKAYRLIKGLLDLNNNKTMPG